MEQKLSWLLLFSILLSGCSLSVERAGIEIMSEPEAKVFIDGKEAGQTPYKNNTLLPKETDFRLVVKNGEWSSKIRLQNRTSTVIHREFDQKTGESSGYVLKIEPTGDKVKAGLLVSSQPDRATIKIDGDTKGTTPNKWDDIGEGERQIDISYPTKNKVVVFAKAISGYQLIVDADLGEEDATEIIPEAVPTITTTEGLVVTIKGTETGWLRVRGQPNTLSAEVGRVNPGEKYRVLDEKEGYYEIEIKGGVKGWISTKYADKILGPDQKTGQ